MKKGLQIITALVIVMAILLAGGIAYTSVAQVWNKITEEGTKANPFADVINLLMGKKAFSVRVDDTQYTIHKIDVVGASGTVLKSIEDSNVIEFPIKPGKKYSINFYVEDPIGNKLTIQSQSFSTREDKGKTILLSGSFNGDVFVFSKAKVYLNGLKSVGGTPIKFPKIMEYSPEPSDASVDCSTQTNFKTQIVNTGLICPAWDKGADKVGFCALGRIDAGFCLPRIYQTTRLSGGIMLNLSNKVYVCEQGLPRASDKDNDIPQEFKELCGVSPSSGDVIMVVTEEISPQLIFTSAENTRIPLSIAINTYSRIFINEKSTRGLESCLDPNRKSILSSYKRGDCKINFYYYKVCPPGYSYDRSTTDGGCIKLEAVN